MSTTEIRTTVRSQTSLQYSTILIPPTMNGLLLLSMYAMMILSITAIVHGNAVGDPEVEALVGFRAPKRCMGQTQVNQWVADRYDGYTIVVTANTTHCRFKSTPLYFTTLTGDGYHFMTTGATSVYFPTATSFYVAISSTRGESSATMLSLMTDRKWRLNWIAFGA